MVNDIAVQDFVNAIKEQPTDNNTTYNATVSRIDSEGVVWVNLYGSDKETPTASSSAEVKRGDSITVEWRNNKLYIGGNTSNPAVGVARVEKNEIATEFAISSAMTAQEAADTAVSEAERAHAAADEAETHAQEAKGSAYNAAEYASRALGNLSTVQSVAETLTWITQHGTMTLTTDTALDPTHVYFVADAQGDYVVGGTHYAIVTEPNVADLSTYYELSINESLNNYVATHLAVDSEGLWIIPDAGGNKVLIATGQGNIYTTAGTYIVDSTGSVTAKFLADRAQVGNDNSSHLIITPEHQTFYHSNGKRQAVEFEKGTVIVGNNGVRQHEMWQELSQYGLSSIHNEFVNFGVELAYIGLYANEIFASQWDVGSTTSTKTISTPLPNSTIYVYWMILAGTAKRLAGVFIAGTASTVEIQSPSTTITYDGDKTFTGIAPDQPSSSPVCVYIEYVTETPGGVVDIGDNNSGTGKDVGRIGRGLKTDSDEQLAVGKWNIPDSNSDYAFIIGNGTADNARSNALAVTWDGNVECGDYSGNYKSIFDIFYPVGSYYETSDATFDPNVSWGGTWVLETEGLVHIGAGSTYTIGDTGGETAHTLTVTEMPSHTHTQESHSHKLPTAVFRYINKTANFAQGTGRKCFSEDNDLYTNTATATNKNTGGGGAHNNMQPYIVVNRWHRTA